MHWRRRSSPTTAPSGPPAFPDRAVFVGECGQRSPVQATCGSGHLGSERTETTPRGENSSFAPVHGLRYSGEDFLGAQTERRGLSRPVRGLLGGKTSPAGYL